MVLAERAETLRSHLAAIVASSSDAVLRETLDGIVAGWNHAVQQLEESEQRLQLAAQVARFGVYDDQGAGRVYWSPELKALFGLPPDFCAEAGAETALHHIHPDDRAAWRAALQAARDPAGTGEMMVEHRIVRPDGSTIWVEQHGRILFEGEGAARRGVRAIGIVQDVTPRKAAEAALRASEERYRELVEQASDIIYTIGPDYRFLEINRQAEVVLGYTREELLALSVAEIVPPEFHARMREMEARKRDGEARTTYELEVLARDGSRVTLEVSSRLVEQDGRPLATQGIARDVTTRKQAEAEREAFISSVSHDLKNPLTTILATLQLLERRTQRQAVVESERLLPALETMQRAVCTATALVQEFVDLSRLEGGHALDLDRSSADLAEMVRHCIEALRQSGQHPAVQLQEQEGAVLSIFIDVSRMERVLGNLLANAVKYGPPGAPIDVVLRHETAGTRAFAVVEVHDRGMGIPADDLPHIFERFYRGRNVRGIAGSGVGLAGVKQIVEQHGGSVTVESAIGEGTIVTVRLPLAAGRAGAAAGDE